jgi:hypothetical protein
MGGGGTEEVGGLQEEATHTRPERSLRRIETFPVAVRLQYIYFMPDVVRQGRGYAVCAIAEFAPCDSPIH